MGPGHWREFIKPTVAKMYAMAKDSGKFVVQHSCGDIQEIFPDLIDIQAQAYVLIYGQILDSRNCEPGFFNVIAYSAMCPNGEEGELCILDITRVINRDEFEMARRECWTV